MESEEMKGEMEERRGEMREERRGAERRGEEKRRREEKRLDERRREEKRGEEDRDRDWTGERMKMSGEGHCDSEWEQIDRPSCRSPHCRDIHHRNDAIN